MATIKIDIRRHSRLYNNGQSADLICGLYLANVLDLLVDTKRPHFNVFAAIRIGAQVFDDEFLVAVVLVLTHSALVGVGAEEQRDFAIGIRFGGEAIGRQRGEPDEHVPSDAQLLIGRSGQCVRRVQIRESNFDIQLSRKLPC